MFMRKMALALAVAVAAIGASFVAASPASAVNSHHVGHPGYEQRCYEAAYHACLYYSSNTGGAYWGNDYPQTDLAPYHWIPGTGSAANTNVRNNSNTIYCTVYEPSDCISYWGTYWSGDYDYTTWGNIGQLWFTINNNASLYIA